MYTPNDASCYLGINPHTLATWLWGRKYPTVKGERYFQPLIDVADSERGLLSFFNLAELHILAATRYQHKVSMGSIRTATETIRTRYGAGHPLLKREFKTNGKDLFLQTIDENENLSQPDQLNFKNIMDTFLQHVVSDEHDLVKKIFPIIAGQPDDRIISITYGVSSSQPVVDGVGVPAWIIRDRYSTGEDFESLADDFDLSVHQVRRAIDYFEQRVS